MTSTDTSFYPTQPGPSAMDIVSSVNQAQHGLQENKLTQMKLQAQQAFGQIVKHNTNPDTGVVDTNAIIRDASQIPATAPFIAEYQQQLHAGNPLTDFMGKDANGIPTPMKAPLSNVMQMGNPGQQVPPNPFATQGQAASAQVPNQLTGGQLQQTPPVTNTNTNGAAVQQPQNGPTISSQAKVDAAWKHINAMRDIHQKILDKDNPTQGDVINSTIEAMNHPDIQGFKATDAAGILGHQSLVGPGGNPPSSQQIKTAARNNLNVINQHAAALPPSSQMLAQQQQAQPSASVGVPTGVGMGMQENQSDFHKHYMDVQNDATSVSTENAALDNVYSLAKKGAPTGTIVGEFYDKLARMVPELSQTADNEAAQLEQIRKHSAQIALATGMPGSDERLHALSSAKVDDQNLPATIMAMVPYLKAVNNSKLDKANYYKNQAGSSNGLDPSKVSNAQSTWNQNWDPRVRELNDMSGDPKAMGDYLGKLDTDSAKQLYQKYQFAKKNGLLRNQ